MAQATPQTQDWNQHYAAGKTPWDSGKASRELAGVLDEGWIKPGGRALEIGCGTGTNAVYLAQRGFEVTAFDVSPLAVAAAADKARAAGVKVRFLQGDALNPPDPATLGGPFPFLFDRGVYHHLRSVNLDRFLAALRQLAAPDALYLTLAGNANEPMPEGVDGPPVVRAADLCAELERDFRLLQLREFRFDAVQPDGRPMTPLAWSALLRRR